MLPARAENSAALSDVRTQGKTMHAPLASLFTAARQLGWLVIMLPVFLTGCGGNKTPQQNASSQQPAAAAQAESKATNFTAEKVNAEHLPNPWRIHPKAISGGLPEGDAAFKELAALGVKTIISVDGAKPDVDLAKQHGLRYVHLPHGYDGISPERSQELAKAVRDLPGPIYIHCHHGKHRSPTAAAVACVSAGLIDPSVAVPFLHAAGTSESYKGLYASANAAQHMQTTALDELKVSFPEVSKLPPLAEAMVAVEHTHDHLKEIAAAGWKSPAKHPDLDPAHEALLLREHFTELLRTAAVQREPEGFQTLLRESQRDSQELENALRGSAAGKDAAPPQSATTLFDRITANCKSCHTTYRDIPLNEKSAPAK
jgi:protein tyrosine phosphatase (PTP) superfamily phosphohydrolase (DUF442 family)